MSILDLAKKDYQGILKDPNAWSVGIVLSNPTNSISINIIGHGMSRNVFLGTDGQMANSKHSHITLVENDLIDNNYPYRNARGVVSLTEHKVSFPDSTGVFKNYKVQQYFPDETLGLIVCILTETK